MHMPNQTRTHFVIPRKLRKGNEVRVIASSRSLSIIGEETKGFAEQRFKQLGLQLSYGQYASQIDVSNSLPTEHRVSDLHTAFLAPHVSALFTVIGGYNSINMISKIDYDIVARNPKIVCGYSDVTVLLNALHARTGLVTYYGPHFSTLGMKKGLEYTVDYMRQTLILDEPIVIEPSSEWSDDTWHIDQENREFLPNPGPVTLQEGECEGRLVGGNINAFRLLNGTPYAPSLKNKILFLENDGLDKDVTYQEFDRRLDSILLQPDASSVRGLIIGRFKRVSQMDIKKIEKTYEKS